VLYKHLEQFKGAWVAVALGEVKPRRCIVLVMSGFLLTSMQTQGCMQSVGLTMCYSWFWACSHASCFWFVKIHHKNLV